MADIVWTPPADLVEQANVTRLMRAHGVPDAAQLLARSVADPEWFWPAIIEDLGVRFDHPFGTVRDTSSGIPWTEWFVGGRLNLAANCLDRHLDGPLADHVCLVGEKEDGTSSSYTFRELASAVDACAGGLRAFDIAKGDRVAAYMPMTVEVVIQMLACLRVGAIFIPIFSGYAAGAVAERLRDAGARFVFTVDASTRRGQFSPIKVSADAAVRQCPTVERVIVVRASGITLPWHSRRDIWWEEFLAMGAGGPAEPMASMDPALLLYTSGTAGPPKGTVHSHAGTLVQIAKETGYAFDLQPGDRFFWLTDIGWMMGPWAILGGLFHGATVVILDGAFDWPKPDRLWELLARQQVTVAGLAPTAARLTMQHEADLVQRHDLSTLRILGSTGEPWDEASWRWYFETVGGGRCPIINISGGTDIIGCFLSPLPIHPLKPCTLVGPGLGMAVDVWNEAGEPVRGEVGYLVATQPAPSMTRGLWNDADRYLETYWSTWPDVWNHGDWAAVDDDGYWFLHGRADDTIKVAGKRTGPAEIEGALLSTGKVVEAAAVGAPHEVKGETIVCYVVPAASAEPSDALRRELADAVEYQVGRVDRPDQVLFVTDLPKTRSGKIVRRLVLAKHLGATELGDLSSIQNPSALDALDEAR